MIPLATLSIITTLAGAHLGAHHAAEASGMGGFLLLGFLIGMSHALEADHLAAVGALAADPRGGRRALVLRGAVWGLGHTLTLLALSLAVVTFGLVLTETRSAALEFGVGVMLVLLGLDVVRRMRRGRIHFHAHDHGDGKRHIHAHSHAGEEATHSESAHAHAHPVGFPIRALVVGLIHGAAGSAGLLALALAATQDAWVVAGYVAVFGLGSMAGMALLSFAASWPISWAERGAIWAYRGLTGTAAVVAIVIGLQVMFETGPIAWGAL